MRSVSFKKWLILLLLLLPLTMGFIKVELEPNTTSLGEPFYLVLTVQNPQSQATPNLSPLRQDFNILETQQSMSYSFINGQAQSSAQWRMLLMPKRSGKLIIPALTIGKESSTPTTIEVTATAKDEPVQSDHSNSGEDATVMIKAQADLTEAYINQQLIYTVQLYNRSQLLDVQYTPPKVNNALLIPLGTTKQDRTILNGQTYQVETQQYAIFPQKSGTLTISPPKITALAYDIVPEQIAVSGKKVSISVKPIPEKHPFNWLPAKKVLLSEQFSNEEPSFKKGSTVTRLITIEATGVPAQLLPELSFASNASFQIYPDKSEISNHYKEDNIVGTRTIKINYLLNKSGAVVLPKITLHWFNTNTGQMELASIPAHTVYVADNDTSPPAPPPSITSSPTTEKPSPTLPTSTSSPLSITGWIAIALGFAWGMTLLIWWGNSKHFFRKSHKKALRQLKRACYDHHPEKAKEALMAYARSLWPQRDFLNLTDLGKAFHDPYIRQQIQLLSQALYSKEKQTQWLGVELWQAICTYRPLKTKKGGGNDLPPIHPTL